MPEGHAGYAAPTARVPRTLSAHFHHDGNAEFPPLSSTGNSETFILLPDNWNGTDAIVVWFLGGETVAGQFDFTVNAGSCDEAFNTHSGQSLNKVVNLVLDEYECVDLTADLAALIALLAARDMLWFTVHDDLAVSAYVVKVEVQET